MFKAILIGGSRISGGAIKNSRGGNIINSNRINQNSFYFNNNSIMIKNFSEFLKKTNYTTKNSTNSDFFESNFKLESPPEHIPSVSWEKIKNDNKIL